MRHSWVLLSLCVVTQLCLVGWITPHRAPVQRVSRHPRIEGISLLVNRIAESKCGIFDPVGPAEPWAWPVPTAPPGGTSADGEPWMDPEWTVPPPPKVDSLAPPEEVHRIIELEAARNRIDPLLIEALVRNESAYDPWAVSRAGALGLMQLMPETATQMGVTDPFDPAQNIAGGTAYLALQLRSFGGDVQLALAAYNAGPAAVERWGGVPPYPETMEYVHRVVEDYRQLVQQAPTTPSADPEGLSPTGSL